MKYIIASKTFFATISITLSLAACAEDYPIMWNLHTDLEPSTLCIEIGFGMPGTFRTDTVTLVPSQTEAIRVREGFVYAFHEHPAGMQFYTHPRLTQIVPGEPTEIFVYSVQAEEIGDNYIQIKENSFAVAYFADFYADSSNVTVVSANPLIEFTTELRPAIPIRQLIEALHDSQYAYEITPKKDRNDVVSFLKNYGYIVESRIDGSYHWLERGFP